MLKVNFNLEILNKKFNKLTIIEIHNEYKNDKRLISCRCDCGNIKKTRIDSVIHGVTKSCGCIRRSNLVNQQIGYLKAIRYIGEDRNKNSIWEFQCICGKFIERQANQIKAKNRALHCGCKYLGPSDSARNALYGKYRHAAKKRELEFTITKDEFKYLTSSNCYYCGTVPSASIHRKGFKQEYIYNGIDRLNNNIGYIINNCVPCCKTCNVAKATYTIEYFLEWIEKIYNKQFKGNNGFNI